MSRALLAAALCALASPAAAGDDADVRAAEAARFVATTRNDLEALAKLLADDLSYAHSNGAVDTKAQYLESLRSGRVRYESIEPSEVQVRLFGATAVVTGRAKVSVTSQGQTKELDLRYTDVWVRRRGRWQMVAWQSTRLPDAAPAK